MTGSDTDTVAFYDASAADYAEFTRADIPQELTQFIEMAPKGGRVLDWGCGHGWAARMMMDAGLDVDARDAAEGFAALALDQYGVTVRVETFAALAETAVFDGAWVSFSLLHIPRDEMPDALRRLFAALKPGGVAYLGLKEGDGEKRDRLGRFYTYYGESELDGLLTEAGFQTISRHRRMQSGLAGGKDPCLHVFCRRP